MRRERSWLLNAFWCIFWWGLWGVLTKLASARLSVAQMQVMFTLGMLPLAIAALIGMRGKLERDLRGAAYGILNGVFTGLGLLAYDAAMSKGKASIVGPLTAMFPLVTVGLAVIVLRERINRVQAVGVVLALAAIILLAS
jgi:bacterial/archaeal transporter family protein